MLVEGADLVTVYCTNLGTKYTADYTKIKYI